MIRTRKLS